MPYNKNWAPKLRSKSFTVSFIDTAGRLRVTGPFRKVRRAWTDNYVFQGSGVAQMRVVGISSISAVVELDQPASSGGGTQLMTASGSSADYSGTTGVVWFEGD